MRRSSSSRPGGDSSRLSSREPVDTRPQPAGFGNCAGCPYLVSGPAKICFDCAKSSFERLAENRCDLCELALKEDGSCGNPLCSWEEDSRFFKWVWAISMRTGSLRRAIDRYKVEGRRAWAAIFGRVLLGYLNAHDVAFQRYDLIIPSPTWVGKGGRAFDHTELVIKRAITEDDGTWPFQTRVIPEDRGDYPVPREDLEEALRDRRTRVEARAVRPRRRVGPWKACPGLRRCLHGGPHAPCGREVAARRRCCGGLRDRAGASALRWERMSITAPCRTPGHTLQPNLDPRRNNRGFDSARPLRPARDAECRLA